MISYYLSLLLLTQYNSEVAGKRIIFSTSKLHQQYSIVPTYIIIIVKGPSPE